MKKKQIILIVIALSTMVVLILGLYLNKVNRYKITSFEQGYINWGDENVAIFDEIENTDHYLVSLYANDKLIKTLTTKEGKATFGHLTLNKGDELKITVTAYLKDDVTRTYNNFKYKYKGDQKRPIYIYLSPSNQTDNEGVKRAGYTTEGEMMNKVADVVYKRLQDHGYKVYRNRIDMTLKEMFEESNKIGVNLHLAIHSNAYRGDEQDEVWGTETWVYDENSPMLDFAYRLQDAIMEIYPYRYGDRGVKFSSEQFDIAEVNPAKVANSVLIELAFHDNYDDAKWISENISLIGNQIADTIINYFDET